jgi:hypothetical protein
VQLLMTVKQRQSGIVGNEIKFQLPGSRRPSQHLSSRRKLAGPHFRKFKTVAMKMDRMHVITWVLHAKAVPPVFF